MISIIVPAHNEAEQLRANMPRLISYLEKIFPEHELIIAEDGSKDKTYEVAKGFESKKVRVLSSSKRLGRGLAVAIALKQAKGDIALYMDADLATDLSFIGRLVDEIEKGADVSTGSRLLSGSKVANRSLLRGFFSHGYNLLLRILFNTKIKDHQCGFKAFRRSSVLPLLDEIRNRHWFWDSELLIRAQMKGMKVTEIPVEWEDSGKSTTNLFFDIPDMFLSAIKLRFELW